MKQCKIFSLKSFTSHGFNLTPMELKDVVPFEVKRVYYLVQQGGESTGEHCHKVEEEVFVQVKGTSTILIDRGSGKEEIVLGTSGSAIYLPAYVWHGFKKPSEDCVILAFSSTNYGVDRSDYIEDYEEYLKVRDEKLIG